MKEKKMFGKIFINSSIGVLIHIQAQTYLESVYNIRWLRYARFSCQSITSGRDVRGRTSLDLAIKTRKPCQRIF